MNVYEFLMKTSIEGPCLMRILCLGKSCISQVGGVLLFWVLTVVQTIGDNFWNNFWDNIGTNSGTVFQKKNPPLCNAVLAGGGVLLCWVLSVAQTITNKTSRGQWKTSTTTKCRFLLSLFSRLCE